MTRGRFTSIQVNVDPMGNNIVGDAANEPSITIDPNDPTRMAIGWRQFDSIASNFRQSGWAYSQDAGQTWTFPGVLEPGEFASDPVLDSDLDGNFYYLSLQPNRGPDPYACYLYKSSDGGVTWPQEVYAYGGDRAWLAIDRTNGPGSGHLYYAWNPAFGCCPGSVFTRSADGGLTFMPPIPLQEEPFTGTYSVGPDGALYITGTTNFGVGPLVVLKSMDAQDSGVTPSFPQVVLTNLGGDVVFNLTASPNPGGLLGQIWIATDHSYSPTRGNVYLLASVDPPGSDRLDVRFARSADGGATWSPSVRVNEAAVGSWNWFGMMSVAPNGRIDAVWNDTRNDASPSTPNESELYYSFSLDGGDTWSANEPVSPIFDSYLGWPNQNKLGDYYDMISDNGGASLAYAATFNGEQDVYFVRLTPDCNANGVADEVDISSLASADCNANLTPDECEPDEDCNGNFVQDICDVAGSTSDDCNYNFIPDECEPDEDCNGNFVQDICDIGSGAIRDCNYNEVPDDCELTGNDCNLNAVPDECDLLSGTSADCNDNGIPDECDVAAATSLDCNENDVPDECEEDCNANGVPDDCDVSSQTSDDCQPDGVPDDCQITQAHIVPQYHPCSEIADFGNAWCEDFEEYQIYTQLHGLSGWEGFGGNTASAGFVAAVENHTPGGTKSMYVLAGSDTVRVMNGYDSTASRAWILSARYYIPSTMIGQAAFIVFGDYDTGGLNLAWAMTIRLNATSGTVEDVYTSDTLPLMTDTWVQLLVKLDLDLDLVRTYYNGELLSTKQWTGEGGSPRIRAIDIDGVASSGYFVDDLYVSPAAAYSTDCNDNTIPDECELADLVLEDCNGNMVPDECEPVEDCNGNGVNDICDVASPDGDCNGNYLPDDCEATADCNMNAVQDICDIAGGTSFDCNINSIPDECETDCNANGKVDDLDLSDGRSSDCNENDIPDECDIEAGPSLDCQPDTIPDECQLDQTTIIRESGSCSPDANNGNPWCDDFEDYSLSSIHGLNGWEGWSGDPDAAAPVTADRNHTLGGTQSLDFTMPGADTVRLFQGYDAARASSWVVSAQIYVPSSTIGWAMFSIFSLYNGNIGGNITGARLIPDARFGMIYDNVTGFALPLVTDRWTEIRFVIDFSQDTVDYYYDGVFLSSHAWSVNGATPNIHAFESWIGSSTGFYLDDVSLYPGQSTSTDCNENFIPDACDIADQISSDDNGNGIPDECELNPPTPAPSPNDRLKNRYISFKPNNPGSTVELEVTLTDSLLHPDLIGSTWWVQAPILPVPDQFPKPLVSPGECVATLGSEATAASIDWEAAGCETLHVTGCAVEPTSAYRVRAVTDTAVSNTLVVPTTLQPGGGKWWGDTVGIFNGTEWTAPQGSANIDDALAAIKTWQGGQVIPPGPIPPGNVAHLSVADVEPGNINTVVNFADVLQEILAFQGGVYPFGPADATGNCP